MSKIKDFGTESLQEHLGIVDECDIVSLSDLEEREELYMPKEKEDDDGGSI